MAVPLAVDHFLRSFAKKTWGSQNRQQFYRRIAGLARNGMALAKGVRVLEQRAKKRSGAWAYDPNCLALSEIATRLENGAAFDKALAGWVPPGDMSVLAAGVRSGTIPETLMRLLNSGKAVARIRNSILKELFEPGIMMILVAYLIYLIGTQVVPVMETVVPVAKWPMTAKMMLPMAYVVTGWPAVFILGGVATFIIAFFATLGRWSQHGRTFFDQIPPWSVYRILQGASWIAGFTSLMESGERIESALAIQARMASPWLRARLLAARTKVLNGADIGQALIHTGFLFPDRDLIDDIGVFAGHADFARVLKTLGEEWVQEQEVKIGATIHMIGTFLNIGVNILILMTVLGMNALQSVLSGLH